MAAQAHLNIRQNIPSTRDSWPFITGMGFRNRCHLIYDEFHKDGADMIKNQGEVAFVKTDLVAEFFSLVVPFLRHPITLLTHNSALHLTGSYLPYLNSPLILKWYAQNAGFSHPKLNSLPLGIANQRWSHGESQLLESAKADEGGKKYLLYLNFDTSTNPERSGLVEKFKNKPYTKLSGRKKFPEYLRDLSDSKYALSPEGAGTDCHRIWECLYLNTIPIVRSCHNISFYKKLPILIIDNWDQVTEDFLLNQYDIIKQKKNVASLSLNYWIKNLNLLNIQETTDDRPKP